MSRRVVSADFNLSFTLSYGTTGPDSGESFDEPMGISRAFRAFPPIGQVATREITGWWFQIFFIFTPILGEMIQFDEHIFQMGWFNHQLDKYGMFSLFEMEYCWKTEFRILTS